MRRGRKEERCIRLQKKERAEELQITLGKRRLPCISATFLNVFFLASFKGTVEEGPDFLT